MNSVRSVCMAATCSKCNYLGIYEWRSDYGFVEMCDICGTSLNKEREDYK